VLVATIWFVALLALVAVLIASWISRSLEQASALRDRANTRSEIISAVDEVAFMMVSGYYSPRGLEMGNGDVLSQELMPNTLAFALRAGNPFIALDDRPYRSGDLVVRLQDDHGLFKLNFPDSYLAPGLLREYGVPYQDRTVLIDRLLDYTERSELFRLNGANADAYRRAGRPPPRGSVLLTPWEAHRVLGWDDYASLWSGPQPLSAIATVRDIAGLNVNTAPEAVLRALPGVDDRAVQRLLRYRATRLLMEPLDVDLAAGMALPVDPLLFTYFPADSLRLTVIAAHYPLVHTIAIRLRPIGPIPYRIDYAVDRPQTAADRVLSERADFPDLPLPYNLQ
jgi:Type II secretion system (T2SS), protein K